MVTYTSIIVWRIPWTKEPSRLYSPWGCKELDLTERLSTHAYPSIHVLLFFSTSLEAIMVESYYDPWFSFEVFFFTF